VLVVVGVFGGFSLAVIAASSRGAQEAKPAASNALFISRSKICRGLAS